MAPLAQLAVDGGFAVTGSDMIASHNTQLLTGRGITVHIGQSGQEIADEHQKQPIDWLVVSSAIPLDHPEVQFAKAKGIKVSKRDELINLIITSHKLKLIAVSGTHGKTTTTAMLIWLFKQLGQPVSYSVGTNLSFGTSAQFQPNSQYFIYEADEFDRNMLQFEPEVIVIPALDYDHSDTYPTVADYKAAFAQLIDQSGQVYIWKSVAEYIGASGAKLHLLEQNDPALLGIKLLGQHNRRNGLLAVRVVQDLFKASVEQLQEAISRFPGSERRMEKLSDNLYSDYGHHPTEIAATIALAGELSDKVAIVYQPHQNIRQHQIKDGYAHCFDGAQKVYWLPTYLSREDPNLAVLQPADLIPQSLKDKTKIVEMDDTLAEFIKNDIADGYLVVLMGAGSIDDWARQNLQF